MSTPIFTQPQRQAIETTGTSVIVSAAAGSGKTAVLTERCAYLVCEATPPARCNVDQLLVLTFTESAAAEMRSRIVEAIQARSTARPNDPRLVEQVALVDAAQISTIHAFCLWLVRRWFSHAGIDPAATVLDADEASLIKSEVLDDFFTDLYASDKETEDLLGQVSGEESAQRQAPDDDGHPPDGDRETQGIPSSQAFVRLIDHYGLSEDREVAALVRKLFDFTSSLPDPNGWLDQAHESLADHPEDIVLALSRSFADELDRQIEHCRQTLAKLDPNQSATSFHRSQISAYADQLEAWFLGLKETDDEAQVDRARAKDQGECAPALAAFDAVRQEVALWKFSKARGPNLPKDADPAVVAARKVASNALSDVKNRLFAKRLQKQFALFGVEEWITGLRSTAPYVHTIVSLVRGFAGRYTRRKREMNVLDFADLQRLAYNLLRDDQDSSLPSAVARSLHRRFAHVLVDEFQDINPIQQEIIRLVSYESDPDRANNLFVVGDVKQSIYRFRLAESAVFMDRLARFHLSPEDGLSISLQENFRSRVGILDAVNVIFRQLMGQGCGEIVYDQEAELRPGRGDEDDNPRHPVELHLLERVWSGGDQDQDTPEPGSSNLSDPGRWTPIEREAFLIGQRIRDWVKPLDANPPDDPKSYRDIAILLRAARVNAERISGILNAMGIPAYADVGGSLLGAREVREVLAVLKVFDNPQQDIPLAAVLRGGVVGDPFSEDDLVAIRCHNRDIPFQAAVREFAKSGPDQELRSRLETILARIDRYRIEVRRRPLADVLWNLYQQQGYLAYAGGLPNGVQRRANLLKLHELTRRFGSFRRQGLHRFLKFVRSLDEEKKEVTAAPAIGEADDVVRIMSIHQAKGLEFPLVFVAGLGTKFNLGDRSGRMIFERGSRIGLRVIDRKKMIEYPSAAHRQVASEIESSTRAEELRILYVAMTRARERLILVGSGRDIGRFAESGVSNEGATPLSALSVISATTPLDWIMPALAHLPAGAVRIGGRGSSEKALFDLQLHDVDEMIAWRGLDPDKPQQRATRRAVAGCETLPADEPLAPDDPIPEQVMSRIEYTYPQLVSTSVRASLSASEFKGTYDLLNNPQERSPRGSAEDFTIPPSKYTASDRNQALNRGVLTHRVLQHLDFARAADATNLASQMKRMVTEGVIDSDALEMIDQDAIVWFASTPLAEAIRQAGNAYRREFPYISAEPLTRFDRSVDSASDDRVLVRGIVDGILPVADGVEIVDFKTDAIEPDQVEQRAKRYQPQMELYARAVSQIWRMPVQTCWLVFLSARKTLKCPAVGSG